MRLTNRDVWEAREALQALVALSPPPTVAVSAKLARNLRKANGVLADIGAVLKALAQEYEEARAVVGKDGTRQTVREIPVERRAAYQAEVEELLGQEVDVDVRTISEAELVQCEEKRPGFGIGPGVLFGAWWMFDFGQDEQDGQDGS